MQITNTFEIMRIKLISVTRKDELCSSINTYRFIYVCTAICLYVQVCIHMYNSPYC